MMECSEKFRSIPSAVIRSLPRIMSLLTIIIVIIIIMLISGIKTIDIVFYLFSASFYAVASLSKLYIFTK